MISNRRARLVIRQRTDYSETEFTEMVIWAVPEPVKGSRHGFKYRLAYVVDEVCLLRYDNEAGKGDHKHIGPVELPYEFRGLEQLVGDFTADVRARRTAR